MELGCEEGIQDGKHSAHAQDTHFFYSSQQDAPIKRLCVGNQLMVQGENNVVL